MARHNLARTTTTNILMSFYILLLFSLLFSMLATAAVLHGNRSSVTAQIRDKPSLDAKSPLYFPEVDPEDEDYDDFDLVDSNINYSAVALSQNRDKPSTESLYHPEDEPHHGLVTLHQSVSRQLITRQVLPDFHCPSAPTCDGPTDCLYADPTSCNGFIHCDANGVAWAGYCPMASMVWNDVEKICDYATEKGDVGCGSAPKDTPVVSGRDSNDRNSDTLLPLMHETPPEECCFNSEDWELDRAGYGGFPEACLCALTRLLSNVDEGSLRSISC